MSQQVNWHTDMAGSLTADVGHLRVQVERVARAFRIYVFRREASVDIGASVLLASASEADMPHAMATAQRLAAQHLSLARVA